MCIPTYNGEKFLKQQLESILPQLSEGDEVIVSDDSSTDNTIGVLRSFSDSRIIILENQHFSSPVFNLENALKHAQGDYIFLADQDDIWEKPKVKEMLQILESHLLVISDGTVISETGEELHASIFALLNSGNGLLKNLYKNTYMGCCIAFRRELLKYILPFPPKIAMHDMWIGLNAEIYGTSFFHSKELIRYRRHTQNETPLDAESNNNTLRYKLSYRLYMVYRLASRFIKSRKK